VEQQNSFYLQLDLSLRQSDWNWARTIEIVESIVARVNGFLRSWNFNMYKERVGPLKVALRLNIQEADRQKIEQILEGFKDDGTIVSFVSCDQPWREPDFVILAHELATESALKFKHQSDQSDDICKIYGSARSRGPSNHLFLLLPLTFNCEPSQLHDTKIAGI